MAPEEADDACDWRDWDNFCRVVEAGSFTAAGTRAGLPKSSVSASVTRLEQQLGIRLLERTTRRVRVTEAGEALYARAAPLLIALRDVAADAKSATLEVRGTLRVSAPYESGWLHLSPALARLLKAYPDLRVEIDELRGVPDLIEQGYDVAFVRTTTQLPSSSLVSKRVVAMERAFYASVALCSARGLPQAPEELEAWPAIAEPADQYWEICQGGVEVARVPVQPRIRTSNAEMRVRAAVDGLGVARLASSFVEDYVKRGDLVRVLPAFNSSPSRIYALTPARRLMPAKVRALLDAVGSADE
ncbi:LysR family transcriptional regulator [Cupriavidus basilensis]|uniref:Transcriptional regulator, LysR family n=1 Tax=Cupriavidus basilensis TaxID=68895 RepID=A0A0C4YPC2_9BURK|nr:LysR family transcriptional regulator [Cupriavidus basilensis]AJG22436.1 Transcriptional regulator, LysR family [Cupriavidus basilensis]